MTKEELIQQISNAIEKLRILEACSEKYPELIDLEILEIVCSWLEQMKDDAVSDIMPEFHYQKAFEDISRLNTQQIRSNKEEMMPFLAGLASGGRPFAPLNDIKKAVSDVHTYQVLRNIDFAQRNCVIVGPNGCGKTTLANTFTKSIKKSTGIVIPAQKLLIAPNIVGIPYPDQIDKHYQSYQREVRNYKQTYEYKNGDSFPYELVRKYGDELQNVFLQFLADLNKVKSQVFTAVKGGQKAECLTKVDEAIEIWNDLMQERKLGLDDKDHFVLTFEDITYPAFCMSEGEKEILYLIGRVLFAPENGYIIVDEPEIYLHKTIVNKLWDKLEQKRSDCKFIYLTHDLDFAATRNAQKCWIRRFHHPAYWEIQPLDESEIPEELLLSILGSRKRILFCEGTKDSKDIKAFEVLFPNYTVTPLSSCSAVISYTKAFNNIPNRLVDAFGIIDRDVRPEKQIEAFKVQRIYAYDVAEIENLFLVDDFLQSFATWIHSEDLLKEVDYHKIIIDRFRPQIEKHALDYVTAQINFYFEEQKFHTQKSLDNMKKAFQTFSSAINIEEEYNKRKAYLEDICNRGDYEAVLRVANNKGFASEINNILHIKDYSERAIAFLKNTDAKKYLKSKFPSEL